MWCACSAAVRGIDAAPAEQGGLTTLEQTTHARSFTPGNSQLCSISSVQNYMLHEQNAAGRQLPLAQFIIRAQPFSASLQVFNVLQSCLKVLHLLLLAQADAAAPPGPQCCLARRAAGGLHSERGVGGHGTGSNYCMRHC